MQTRIIKVGGSLLDYDRLVVKLCCWLKEQPIAHNVMLAGGGTLANTFRRWDAQLDLPDSETHWLCIRIMDVTARALALILPETRFLDQFDQLRLEVASEDPRQLVFSCEEFLRCWEETLPGEGLPTGWDVTSDSIAARVAQALSADELVLLKSADPPWPCSTVRAAEEGYVDACFPRIVAGLRRVRCVNLREGSEFELSIAKQ